jgi:tight adherence protein B
MGLWIVIVVGVVGLGAVLGGMIISRQSGSALIEKRLGIAEEREASAATTRERVSPMGDALNRALVSRGVGADLATQLARADLKITVGEFMAATVILIIGAGGVAFFLKKDIVVTVGACLAGFFAPRLYIKVLRGRRLKAFNNQLGDTINLMVNGIRAGYSILQAMESVAHEMGPPIADEFNRVVQETRLGISLEEALDHMLRRVPSDDLDMLITAINVQREVGGNLAEVLDSISFTIRERVRIKGDLAAKTGQSRLSGYMVGLIPIALGGFLYLLNPDYVGQLLDHICGYIMIGVAVLGIVLGFVVMNKIMQIDV